MVYVYKTCVDCIRILARKRRVRFQLPVVPLLLYYNYVRVRTCTNICNGQVVIVRYYVKNAHKVNEQHDIIRSDRHVSIRVFYGFIRLISEFRSFENPIRKTATSFRYNCNKTVFLLGKHKRTDSVPVRCFGRKSAFVRSL